MEHIIEVKNLVKKYGDFEAVKDISFHVNKGEFFGFLGPNGAGKTTTMRILATLLQKTSGDVMVAGLNASTQQDLVRKQIGFAMQDVALDSMANAYENLQLLGVLYGMSKADAKVRAEELIERLGLSKVADKWMKAYSGGLRRRLDLAGVLMHRPNILFLDEPTQGLDPQARRTIWEYIGELNKEGTTVFLTTHYMDEAEQLCGRLCIIDEGKIVAEGSPADITKKAASKNGLGKNPSLEDVFVSMVKKTEVDDESSLNFNNDPFVEGRR
jgi:ABC-2 type transport system ATP-binding protein